MSSLPYSHLCFSFGYKLAWPGRAPGLVPTAAKDGHSYTNIPTTQLTTSNNSPTHPLASFQKWPWNPTTATAYLLSQDIWGGTPSLGAWLQPYDWRAAAPMRQRRFLFVFVLIATCTMACQNLTPGLAPSQHSCMQPHFTPTSSPPTSLHLVAIFVLAINCLSSSHTWACPNRR